MRAVNLLPPDLRGAAPKPARAARPEPTQGIAAYVVLGLLALCVVVLTGYVLTNNGLKQREADLQSAQQETAAATAQVAALKPYADFEALANTRVETVRGLAAARFDWQQALGDLSRAVPRDVKLSGLNGDMGLPGSGSAGGDALRGSIKAPAITLTGCASSQHGVARLMSRVSAVDGVTRVTLSRTTRTVTSGAAEVAGPCGKGSPPTFSLVVFFERAAAISAFGQSTTSAAAAVLTPNAVSGTKSTTPAAGSTVSPTSPTTAAGGTAATPVPDGASVSPSNSTGGTK